MWDKGNCQPTITQTLDTGFEVVSTSPYVVRVTGLTTSFITVQISGNVATWTMPGIPNYAGRTGGPVVATGGFTYRATFTGGVVNGSMSGDYQSGYYCVNNGGAPQPPWSGTLSGFRTATG